MIKGNGKLSVYFENPFWVGIFENTDNNKLTVCKITFGAEPKDSEIYNFILKNYYKLKFSPPVVNVITKHRLNPKRMQREIKKQQKNIAAVSTKSQLALQLQHEQIKSENKSKRRQKKLEDARKKFTLKEQKKKEKHKGR